ncbi:MAG: hypothetical protein JWN99_2521 [Ilumatobacteraceae bacterium]|nr:hypothetical protein [Ilumatobacteraceae bacterium]
MRIHHAGVSRALAIGCMLAVAATSCSSGGSDAGSPTSTVETGSAASSAATLPANDSVSDPGSGATDRAGTDPAPDGATADTTPAANAMPPASPLDAFLGFGEMATVSPEDEAKYAEQSLQAEQLTADCMQALGFTYIPFVADSAPVAGAKDPYSLPADQFAAQYGYGQSTIDESTFPTTPDPNTALVEAMGAGERGEYSKALYGDAITVDEDGNPVFDARAKQALDVAATSGEGVGCQQQANDTVYGSKAGPEPSADTADYPFTAIEASMSALYDSVENDPRVLEATTTWIGCMADAGHPGYTEKTDAPVDVGEKVNELRGDARDLSGADPVELQALRAYEISVATADYACGVPWDATHRAVQDELETAFIDQNRAELEKYRDGIADGTAGHG